jgi:hypothetical protein
MRWPIWLVLVATAPQVAAQPAPPNEPEPVRRTPFDQGRFGLGFGAGSQGTAGGHYYVVSGGAAYYVLDGVEVGLGAGHQFGDDPNISRLTPSLRYVAQPLVGVSPVIPYVGGFGSHYFLYSGFEDIDTLGGRAGLLYVNGSLVLGLGIGYERIVSECTETADKDCSWFYPDFTLSVAL